MPPKSRPVTTNDGVYWQTNDDRTVRVWHGDVIEQLRKLPAQSVHCVVTSPPYYVCAHTTAPEPGKAVILTVIMYKEYGMEKEYAQRGCWSWRIRKKCL